jgi:hypothetical protein
MSDLTQQQIQKLVHDEVLKVFGSRKGADGGRGETGAPGRDGKNSEVPGPQGRPGKDADIGEVVVLAKAALASDVAAVHASVSVVVVQALKDAGVIDQDGKAILLVPRDGVDGRDSEVAGPRGIPGASIIGPSGVNGRDAVVKIGNVVSGDVASVTIRETSAGQVLDFVLPRGSDGADSVVAGPEGKPGRDSDVSQQMDDFRTAINGEVAGITAQLEGRTRHIAKGDIAAAIRGHLNQFHSNDKN